MTQPAPEASRAGCPECGDEYWDRGVGDPCPSCGHPLIPMIEAEIVEEPEAQRELNSLISRIEEAREGSMDLTEDIALASGYASAFLSKHRYWSMTVQIRDTPNGSHKFSWPSAPIPRFDATTGEAIELPEHPWHGWGWDADLPMFSQSLDAKLEGEDIRIVSRFEDGTWEATHHQETEKGFRLFIGNAHTEALARRAAALEALKARLGDNGERDR